MNNIIFKKKAYNHIKRIIGFIDNDVNSTTFGCADRNYWHYKINDYYNARYQESCFTLTFFYLDKDSFLYKNEKLLVLIKSIIYFWLKNLNKKGSVNEVYPYEQSFCATSFTTYIVTEAIILLNLNEMVDKYKEQLNKIGIWLSKNGNWHITNQIAASSIAIYNLGILLNNAEFFKEALRRVFFLKNNYEKNGFFSEYGGFDLGYNTLTMSCLARFYQKICNDRILDLLNHANELISSYLDKYFRYDIINMSRNTEFIYPFSFKITKNLILEKIQAELEKDSILNPDWLDDRYLIGLTNDYLMTYFF